MLIETEETPNPLSLKFIPGFLLLESGGPRLFRSRDEAQLSPLASRLFALEGVTEVLIAPRFVTVVAQSQEEWDVLRLLVMDAIVMHVRSGEPVLSPWLESQETEDSLAQAFFDSLLPADPASQSPEHSEELKNIQEILDLYVQPAVAQDGGYVVLRGYRHGIVYLEMRGSCAGCPSSVHTLQVGIQNVLKMYLPEIQGVQQVG